MYTILPLSGKINLIFFPSLRCIIRCTHFVEDWGLLSTCDSEDTSALNSRKYSTPQSHANSWLQLLKYSIYYSKCGFFISVSAFKYLLFSFYRQFKLHLFCHDFKLSPCSLCSVFSFGYFPGVWGLKVDVSEPSIGSIFLGRWRKNSSFFLNLPRKMEPIEGSETSAFKPQTPGKYPKENILHLFSLQTLWIRQIFR